MLPLTVPHLSTGYTNVKFSKKNPLNFFFFFFRKQVKISSQSKYDIFVISKLQKVQEPNGSGASGVVLPLQWWHVLIIRVCTRHTDATAQSSGFHVNLAP